MKVGLAYVALRSVRVELAGPDGDATDDDSAPPCFLEAGRAYVAIGPRLVMDEAHQRNLWLPAHLAANPLWWAKKPGQLGIAAIPTVTVTELAHQLVLHNPGLQLDDLYRLACDNPITDRPVAYNTFSATLSTDKSVELRNQETGIPVDRVGHNTRCNTYHIRRAVLPVQRAR